MDQFYVGLIILCILILVIYWLCQSKTHKKIDINDHEMRYPNVYRDHTVSQVADVPVNKNRSKIRDI